MSNLINFETKSEIDERREEKKKQMEKILNKAHKKYENANNLKKQQLDSILPSIHLRVQQEEEEISKVNSKKQKRKKEKHKKSKKERKKKKEKYESDNSSCENEWTEKGNKSSEEEKEENNILNKSSSADHLQDNPLFNLKRQDWMLSGDFDLVSKITSSSSSSNKKKEKVPEEMGQHERELNPFWKNGGSGLPEKKGISPKLSMSGDGGLSWWRKGLKRCQEAAMETGRSLEEEAADRYGSLEILMEKIKKAEIYFKSNNNDNNNNNNNNNFSSLTRHHHQNSRPHFKHKTFKSPIENNNTEDDYNNNNNNYNKYDNNKNYNDVPRWKNKDYNNNNKNYDNYNKNHDNDNKNYNNFSKNNDNGKKNYDKCKNYDNKKSNEVINKIEKKEEKEFEKKKNNQEKSKKVKEEEKNELITMTIEEKNKISAKILRAEMMGNMELAKSLKEQLENAKKNEEIKKNSQLEDEDENEQLLILMDNKKGPRPFQGLRVQGSSCEKHKRKKLETHEEGKRVRYFRDDDHLSLKDLVEKEKMTSGEDDRLLFASLIAKKIDEDDDSLDDEALRKGSFVRSEAYVRSRAEQLSIIEQKKLSLKMEKCSTCFNNIEKHLVVAIGKNVLLSLPRYKSMVEGHCWISPLLHTIQSTSADEDVLREIETFKHQLIQMFSQENHDVIFMETSKNLKSSPHLIIECIPVPMEIGHMAPIYFKKAIMECEREWSQNKKLVTIGNRNIKQAIPRGFPYFHVAFGRDQGFGHVIEDEHSFPHYFGREVVGGMLDIEATLWRKPRVEGLDEQKKKVDSFSRNWKNFDHTLNQ